VARAAKTTEPRAAATEIWIWYSGAAAPARPVKYLLRSKVK
jgi:hypothetical protein